MINTLKWEAMKRFHQTGLILAVSVLWICALAIFPVSKTPSEGYEFVMGLSSIFFCFSTLLFCLCYPVIIIILDYKCVSCTMEIAAGQSAFNVLLSKLLMSLCTFFVGSGIGYMGSAVMKRFATASESFFSINMNVPYFYVLYYMVFQIPITALFCYMLASAISRFRSWRIAGTVLFAAAFYGLYLSSRLLDPAANALFSAFNIASVLLSLLMFAGSCLLAEKRYEPE